MLNKSIVLFLEGEDKLSTEARKNLPESDFALPNRRYPIHDKTHARLALAMVSRFGSPEEKEKVRSAVHSKYPEIGHGEQPKE